MDSGEKFMIELKEKKTQINFENVKESKKLMTISKKILFRSYFF